MHVCAVLEQERHNSCAAPASCPPQRHIILGVHVHAVEEEDLQDVHVAHLGGVAQGPVVSCVIASPVLQEERHNLGAPVCDSEVECIPARGVIPISLHVHFVLDEEPHDVHVAMLACQIQRSANSVLATFHSVLRDARAHAAPEEKLHNRRVAIFRRPQQRLASTVVKVCAALEEELHNGHLAMLRRRPQCFATPGVHVCTGSHQQLSRLHMAALGRTG